jgi:hypothetical protein
MYQEGQALSVIKLSLEPTRKSWMEKAYDANILISLTVILPAASR